MGVSQPCGLGTKQPLAGGAGGVCEGYQAAPIVVPRPCPFTGRLGLGLGCL